MQSHVLMGVVATRAGNGANNDKCCSTCNPMFLWELLLLAMVRDLLLTLTVSLQSHVLMGVVATQMKYSLGGDTTRRMLQSHVLMGVVATGGFAGGRDH